MDNIEMDPENNNAKKSTSQHRKRCYRNLLNRIEGLQENEDIGIHAVKEVGEILKEVYLIDSQCKFQERVEYADETLLESVVLSSASSILVKCIENLNIFNSTYEPTEFATKLLNGLDDSEKEFETSDWLNILEDARAIVPELPPYSFLYGTFDPTKIPEQKQRKVHRRDLQEKAEKKQLQRIENAEKDEEGVDDTINFLGRILTNEYENNNSEPIKYFDFVVDSENFALTIENMFYCSFLIRDGKAKLDIGEDGMPILRPQRKRDLKAFRNEGGVNVQMIASLTMAEWEALRSKEGYIQQHRRQMRSKS
ncbi:hypothetical protein ILUMI_18137 [Ignelater luminosus]|uniref:Non-structural maintenance of chromosomes element 4 n=1 Tax=Ignelater luminosus TaxID=2038154 RepID=A0A8K0CLX9_IGNLU|nr:hypothetical protein ILUMI_18137 [Ignelater luminosus]